MKTAADLWHMVVGAEKFLDTGEDAVHHFLMWSTFCEKRRHIPAESVRDDGVRLCAICHEPLKESE